MFFVDPNFTWPLGLVMHFYWFSGWGSLEDEVPKKILGDFQAIFQHFRTYEIFFAFLGGAGGEAPGNFLRFFNFLTRGGGGTENFFLTFFWLFDVWKKSRGGGARRKIFSWRHFFTAPKDTENLPKSQKGAFQRRSEALNVFKRPQRCFLHALDILETFDEKIFSSHFDHQN